jgi:hypothetical protein
MRDSTKKAGAVFPVIDLNFAWEEFYERSVPIYTTPYIFTNSNEIFEKYYSNHLIVDSNFDIYKIVGKRASSFIRKFIFHRYELVIHRQETKVTLKEVKDYLIENMTFLNEEKYTIINGQIIEEIKSAISFENICQGEKINFQFL